MKDYRKRLLVSVHGYAGDQTQIENAMPFFLHHYDAPVVIMSPVDSPILQVKAAPTVICRQAGKRAYVGPLSLTRQLLQMKALLDYPYDLFLMNDADSVCISRDIPDYIFREPDVLWSNEVSDTMHARRLPYHFPRLAFQPPYVISRKNIERMLMVGKNVRVDATTPFIDWAMMAWAITANMPHKNYLNGISCPTRNHPPGVKWMSDSVRRGTAFLHSIKDKEILLQMAEQHSLYCGEQLGGDYQI